MNKEKGVRCCGSKPKSPRVESKLKALEGVARVQGDQSAEWTDAVVVAQTTRTSAKKYINA